MRKKLEAIENKKKNLRSKIGTEKSEIKQERKIEKWLKEKSLFWRLGEKKDRESNKR